MIFFFIVIRAQFQNTTDWKPTLIFYSFLWKMTFSFYSFIKMVNVFSCYQSFFLRVTQIWIRKLAELHPQILYPLEAKTNLVHVHEREPNLLNADTSHTCRRTPVEDKEYIVFMDSLSIADEALLKFKFTKVFVFESIRQENSSYSHCKCSWCFS